MKVFLTFSAFLAVVLFSQCNKKRNTENCFERINKDCYCPAVVDPVCGCNNKTYGNACEAACAGITDYTMGPCQ